MSGSATEERRSDGAAPAATWSIVWGTWAALVAGSLAMIARYGSNVPYLDGWDMVPTLTGEQPVTLEWLWSQHNEHRVPLPRLMLLALNSVVIDFRIGMVFDLLATAAVALLLVVALQRARGGLRVTDVLVPVVLLNPAHAVNVLWSWQVQFYASALLAGLVLATIISTGQGRGDVRPARAALLVGLATVLLTLCGGNGVGLVPPLAVWVGWVGWRHRASAAPGERGRARAALVLAAAALLLTGLYFVGYEGVPYHPRNPGIRSKLAETVEVLTAGLGVSVRHVWPVGGIVAMALLVAATGACAWSWRTRSDERDRAAGLVAFMAAVAALGAAIGTSRDGFEPRYVTIMAPLWCGAYAAFSLQAPARAAAAGRWVLCAAGALLLVPNTAVGLARGREVRAALGGFERDAAAGVPLDRLIARYGPWLHPHHDVPQDYAPLLRRAGVGAFAALRDPTPVAAVTLPLAPAHLEKVTWTGRKATMTGSMPHMVFDLPAPLRAQSIRLRYRHRNDDGTAPYVRVYWRGAGEADFVPERSWKASATGDRANWERFAWTRLEDDATTMNVHFEEVVIDAIRIDPDFRRGEFEVLELVVLCPAITTK